MCLKGECRCAIKFHCLVSHLQQHSNQRFLFDVVIDLIEYTNALIQSRLNAQSRESKSIYPRVVRYLGRKAFLAILKRKQSAYSVVISTLSSQILTDPYFTGTPESLEQMCAAALHPDRHRLFFREILF